jgi:ATP-dependent RNA helicase DDX31/DBP7
MEIFIATNSGSAPTSGKSRNEKHDQFLKRRQASSQPHRSLNKREQREQREQREAKSKQASEWREQNVAKNGKRDGYHARTQARVDLKGAGDKATPSIKAPEPCAVLPAEAASSTAQAKAKAVALAPVEAAEAAEAKVTEELQRAGLEVFRGSEAVKAMASDGESKGVCRQSRKNPVRIADEAYSAYHMSAQALSANALRNPVASNSSAHIFATAESFSNFNLHPRLVALLQGPRESGGFALERPTRVQSGALRCLLEGRSAFLKAQTGSGKTLAFLLPLVQKLQALPTQPKREDGTLGLVLAPTRELCTQIFDVLVRLIQPFIWLVPGAITGGERRKSEKQRLRKGVTILVATPGRLLDHLSSTEAFRHDKLAVLVLDECDRLMDSGFATQIQDILKLLRSKDGLQTILASATATAAVQTLLLEHMGPHDVVDANPEGPQSPEKASSRAPSKRFDPPQQLMQHSLNVTYKLKLPALCALLRQCWRDRQKVILFVSTTASVDYLATLFASCAWPHVDPAPTAAETAALFSGWPLFRLHGNIPQLERQAAKKAFHALKSGLLVTTDVAARGLDLPNVDWVIQLDAPTAIEGRSSRSSIIRFLSFSNVCELCFFQITFTASAALLGEGSPAARSCS